MDQVHSINPFKSPFPLIKMVVALPNPRSLLTWRKQQQFEPLQQRKRRYQNHYYNPQNELDL